MFFRPRYVAVSTRIRPVIFVCIALLSAACVGIETPQKAGVATKWGSKDLARSEWADIKVQDLAILLPRTESIKISMVDVGASGQPLFPAHWWHTVGLTFGVTDARGAFTDENNIEDWQVASVRISPCSPLGKRPGREATLFCWPEIRVVWQPVLYDYHIGWKYVEAFSDDRAIHASYYFYPQAQSEIY